MDAYREYVEARRAREVARATAKPVEARPGTDRPGRRGLRRLPWMARLPLGGFAVYYVFAAAGCAQWAAANGWDPVLSALLGPLFLAALGWLPALVILGVLLIVGEALDDRRGP